MAPKKTAKMSHRKGSSTGGHGDTLVGSYPTGRTVKPSFGQLGGLLRGYSVFDAAGDEIAVGLGMWEAIDLAKSGADPDGL